MSMLLFYSVIISLYHMTKVAGWKALPEAGDVVLEMKDRKRADEVGSALFCIKTFEQDKIYKNINY